MEKINSRIQEKAEKLQNDCHKTVEAIMKASDVATYNDATNIWLFRKLAELEIELENKEEKKWFI